MARKYISLERIQSLHESINFLDTFENLSDDEIHIGNTIDEVDIEKTKLLNELCLINRRRDIIIDSIMESYKK